MNYKQDKIILMVSRVFQETEKGNVYCKSTAAATHTNTAIELVV